MRSVEFSGETIQPGKIVCIGKNYVAHIEEMGSPIPDNMVVFGKPNSAISHVLKSHDGEPLHYEGEICLLIRDGVIKGIGFGIDLTKRGLQRQLKDAGLPWERSKAFDGAAVFSSFIPAPASLDKLLLELRVNDELRQRGGVDLMMYKPDIILSELGEFMTLDDNDIVMTGTPAGVGEIRAGEHFNGRLLDGERELINVTWIAH